MKTFLRLLAVPMLVMTLPCAQAAAGYVNTQFAVGDTLFCNPLQNVPNNNLSTLFYGAPEGTTIWLWNSDTLAFDSPATFSGGSWSVDLTLNPGTGALLRTATPFLNTFVGNVLNHDGTPGTDPIRPALPYAGPDGLYLWADKTPIAASCQDAFVNVVGRQPRVGEQMITLSTTSTYLGGGVWENDRVRSVTESGFFNIGPVVTPNPFPVLPVVPEPATGTLAVMGLLLLIGCRGR